jgi:D-glycero-D-manno-heptose 1,7-bisphosphate phosphatase
MRAITQAYILCGGLGTRLGSMVKDTPKPMLPVGGKPILQHTIEHLKRHGITNAILVAGYKGDVVERFFAGVDFGMTIHIFVEEELLGTGGALPKLKDKLDENFLMMSGDVFIDFDVTSLIRDHLEHKPLATILSGPSTSPWASNLIQADGARVTRFVFKEEVKSEAGGPYQNNGNRSIYCLDKRILKYIPGPCDIERTAFVAALEAGEPMRIHPQAPGDFIRDMGKPERFPIVERYLRWRAARDEARSHPKKIRCAFLDRDGVINKEVRLCARPEDFELLPGAAEAIRLLSEQGIQAIVASNQPVLARGLCDRETFDAITRKMHDELAKHGARLDAYYYCPHHPETQWGEGVKELRRGCDCRKPATGMLEQAWEERGLDLGACIMIGDSFRDVEAARNAGIRSIFLATGRGDTKEGMRPDATFPTLLDAARAIVEERFDP